MLLWLTDTHFNFLRKGNISFSPVRIFGEYLMAENPSAEGLIITGDISTGESIVTHLREFAEGFTKPIFFVLGNHDFYDSTFTAVEAQVSGAIAMYKDNGITNLHWLNDGFYEHDDHLIVGVGGWYDAYHGNQNSPVLISDFHFIKDLRPGLRHSTILLSLVRERAKKEADVLASMLRAACKKPNKNVIVCTHVAPYPEASWHEGAISNRDFLPWFSSASTGAVLDVYSRKFPEKNFVVLVGHSHSPGIFRKHDNVVVYTGKAVYGAPDLAGVINTKEKIISCYNHLMNKVEINYENPTV